MTDETKKTTVILGAGASFDSWNTDPRNAQEQWWPPLAAHLFGSHPSDTRRRKRADSFIRTLNRYPGAEYVAGLLNQMNIGEDYRFEDELTRIASNPNLAKHFREVPPYISDIISEVSVHFGRTSGNYAALIADLIISPDDEVLFITLNYDTLLEQALSRFDSASYSFSSMDHYVARDEDRQAKVVKVHGSCNWHRALYNPLTRPSLSTTWDDLLDDHGLELLDEDIHVQNLGSGESVRALTVRFEYGDGQVIDVPAYPVITAPLAAKSDDDLVCPSNHSQYAREFVAKCDKFLVIGTSGNDTDLLGLLSESGISARVVHYVNDRATTAEKVRSRFEVKVPAFGTATSIYAHDAGFGRYLGSDQWDEFRTA
ncbi:MAG: SIR2 family protein [Chloroflexi bacterium]|nr:SIR2 family protein [Chloroflexota bacterium]